MLQVLIAKAWLCASCLMARTGLPRASVYETLNALAAKADGFRTDVRRCAGCLGESVVHRIG